MYYCRSPACFDIPIRHENDLSTLFPNARKHGVEIVSDLDGIGCPKPAPFYELVRPGESFSGFSDEQPLEIARTPGMMDTDELRV